MKSQSRFYVMAVVNNVSLRPLLSCMPINLIHSKLLKQPQINLTVSSLYFPSPTRLSTPKDTGQMGKMSF